MPYIMVMGSLSAPHLSKDEGATVYGLKSEERTTLVRELNSSFGMSIASYSEPERTVRVQKGLTLMVVNRLHALLGYDVVSHAMAMTNANRDLVSFTMYKKSSGPHGHKSPKPHVSHATNASHGGHHSNVSHGGHHPNASHGGHNPNASHGSHSSHGAHTHAAHATHSTHNVVNL